MINTLVFSFISTRATSLFDCQILELRSHSLESGNLDFLGHALGKLLLDSQLGCLVRPRDTLRFSDGLPITSPDGKIAVGSYHSLAVCLCAHQTCNNVALETILF